jgi:hypothetical protein
MSGAMGGSGSGTGGMVVPPAPPLGGREPPPSRGGWFRGWFRVWNHLSGVVIGAHFSDEFQGTFAVSAYRLGYLVRACVGVGGAVGGNSLTLAVVFGGEPVEPGCGWVRPSRSRT